MVADTIWHPSPNFGERRGARRPDLIVLHYTAMESAEAALERLCAPEFEVSCHYLIARDGRAFQLVDEGKRAWHAGAGQWRGQDDINSRSIGIELDNDGASPFSEPLMAALERLMPDVMARWSIPPAQVIGHSDMAPGRKGDPGRRFDWARLARRGLACHPAAGQEGAGIGVDDAQFRALLEQIGYPEAASGDLLQAFRLRFRPWGRGPLAAQDMQVAALAARLFAVDGGVAGS